MGFLVSLKLDVSENCVCSRACVRACVCACDTVCALMCACKRVNVFVLVGRLKACGSRKDNFSCQKVRVNLQVMLSLRLETPRPAAFTSFPGTTYVSRTWNRLHCLRVVHLVIL